MEKASSPDIIVLLSRRFFRNPGQKLKSILIAEDSATQLLFLTSLLKRLGYSVATATNGEQALSLAEQQRFSAVITDYEMPEMDGLALCSALRKLHTMKGCPVILLTADTSNKVRVAARKAGATSLLPKPIKSSSLKQELKRLL